jgi:hypothetical protein
LWGERRRGGRAICRALAHRTLPRPIAGTAPPLPLNRPHLTHQPTPTGAPTDAPPGAATDAPTGAPTDAPAGTSTAPTPTAPNAPRLQRGRLCAGRRAGGAGRRLLPRGRQPGCEFGWFSVVLMLFLAYLSWVRGPSAWVAPRASNEAAKPGFGKLFSEAFRGACTRGLVGAGRRMLPRGREFG